LSRQTTQFQLYRLYNNVTGAHFYTAKESEKDKLIANYSNIYTFEGVAFYAYFSEAPDTPPVSVQCTGFTTV